MMIFGEEGSASIPWRNVSEQTLARREVVKYIMVMHRSVPLNFALCRHSVPLVLIHKPFTEDTIF